MDIEKFIDFLVDYFLDKYDLFNKKRFGCDSYTDDEISFKTEGNRITLVMSFPWELDYFSDKTLQYENIKFIFQVVVFLIMVVLIQIGKHFHIHLKLNQCY